MIEFLRGKLVRATPDAVILDCGGLGLRARTRDGERFRKLVGREVELPAWLAFWPRGADLFAFADEAERARFVELIAIPGVGATTALRLLPHHAALTAGPEASVPEIPGVGAAIRAKVARWVRRRAATADGARVPKAELRPLIAALRALGIPAAEAKSRADDALSRRPTGTIDEWIRLAVERK